MQIVILTESNRVRVGAIFSLTFLLQPAADPDDLQSGKCFCFQDILTARRISCFI